MKHKIFIGSLALISIAILIWAIATPTHIVDNQHNPSKPKAQSKRVQVTGIPCLQMKNNPQIVYTEDCGNYSNNYSCDSCSNIGQGPDGNEKCCCVNCHY